MRGVKKLGKKRGLSIRYLDPLTTHGAVNGGEEDANWKKVTDGDGTEVVVMTEREEIFTRVSNRDEVFAKIVGWGGRNWITV